MGLDHADAHRPPLPACSLGGHQHGKGLADAGIGAEEDLEPPAAGSFVLALHLGEQRIGVGALVAQSHFRRLKRQYSAPLTSAITARAIG